MLAAVLAAHAAAQLEPLYPIPTAFKGGTLVPLPPLASLVAATDGVGSLAIAWSAWPSAAPGEDWFFQYGIKDPIATHGAALSNALQAVEPGL